MTDITVVIPVYNVERYIQKCLDCFFVDTPIKLEILAIDDCSTDGSLAILRKNELSRPNLRVIESERNQGVSALRNLGVRQAHGKYIYFCDSDDTLDFKGIETLFQMAEDQSLDVSIGYRYELYEETGEALYKKLGVQDTGVVSGKEFLYISMTDKLQGIGPWQNLYLKNFLIDNDLWCLLDNNHQDNELMPRVMLVAQRVRSIDLPFYCHLIRQGTLSHHNNYARTVSNRLEIIRIQYQLVLDNHKERRTRLALSTLLAYNLAKMIRSASMLPVHDKKIVMKELRDRRYAREAIHSLRRNTKFLALCVLVSPELTCLFFKHRQNQRQSG